MCALHVASVCLHVCAHVCACSPERGRCSSSPGSLYPKFSQVSWSHSSGSQYWSDGTLRAEGQACPLCPTVFTFAFSPLPGMVTAWHTGYIVGSMAWGIQAHSWSSAWVGEAGEGGWGPSGLLERWPGTGLHFFPDLSLVSLTGKCCPISLVSLGLWEVLGFPWAQTFEMVLENIGTLLSPGYL
jgi:hypothetical protein